MRDYRPLPPCVLNGELELRRPDPPKSVVLDSDAADVMTDFAYVHIAVIAPDTAIDAAKAYMIQRGVRLLFVLGPAKNLLGVVTANDVQGDKPMRLVQERGMHHDEVCVSDIMTPLAKFEAVSIDEVRHSRVGHVLATLKGAGRQHALAVDIDERGQQRVCGMFSLSQVARQLGISVQTTEIAKSFAEIEVMLAAH